MMCLMRKLIIAAIISSFVLIGAWYLFHQSSLVEMYNERWGILLPQNMQLQYNLSSDHGITGDGDRYSVFMSSENDVFVVGLQNDYGKEMQSEFMATIKELKESDDFRVDEQYYPAFDNYNFMKIEKNNDMLMIIYSKNGSMLYILEELI